MTTVTQFGRIGRFIGAAVCAATLTACATTDPVSATKAAVPTMDDLLSKATAASTTGQKEQAIALWKQAAAAYPTDKAPWISIAQSRFDAEQYGEAIVNAQEVLVRDPNDSVANSIIAISGLRVATRALGDLSRQNNLNGNTRTNATELAKMLRETLGETALVTTTSSAVGQPPSNTKAKNVKDKPGTKNNNKKQKVETPFDTLMQ
jgi:predicted Zn-dependent protease